METSELLSKLGLSKKESKIYMTLVENGPMAISGISQSSDLHRPAVYKVLPELEKRGLVTTTPYGKLKHYVAESPKKLKLLVEEMSETLLTALPDLENMYESKGYRPVVKFFQGRKGVGEVFMDLVNSMSRKGTYYRYTSNKDLLKTEKYLPKNYRTIRDRKQLERLIINNAESSKQKQNALNRAVKNMPVEFDLFDYEVSMLIYADKIAFIDFNTETAVVIENKKIAEFQRKLFMFIYRKL